MAKKTAFVAIQVYVSPKEKSIIEKEAKKGHRSMSKYLKLRGLKLI